MTKLFSGSAIIFRSLGTGSAKTGSAIDVRINDAVANFTRNPGTLPREAKFFFFFFFVGNLCSNKTQAFCLRFAPHPASQGLPAAFHS